MKQAIALSTLTVALMGLLIVGCQSNKNKDLPVASGVTDVSASPTPAPAYVPPPPVAQQPVYDTMPNNTTGTDYGAAGGSYTVKKGDTLYSIARNRYGDGKQWQRIAAANPGVRPETLKVGQTITVP